MHFVLLRLSLLKLWGEIYESALLKAHGFITFAPTRQEYDSSDAKSLSYGNFP